VAANAKLEKPAYELTGTQTNGNIVKKLYAQHAAYFT
jgi:hypothetical protein